MKHSTNDMPPHIPDSVSLGSEAVLAGSWDSGVLAEILRRKWRSGEAPAFLLLGRREAALLRSHLAAAFGDEAVSTLKGSYYMGLEIVEIDFPEFFHTGGLKRPPRPSGLTGGGRAGMDSGSAWRFTLE